MKYLKWLIWLVVFAVVFFLLTAIMKVNHVSHMTHTVTDLNGTLLKHKFVVFIWQLILYAVIYVIWGVKIHRTKLKLYSTLPEGREGKERAKAIDKYCANLLVYRWYFIAFGVVVYAMSLIISYG